MSNELKACPFCGGEASGTGVLRRSSPSKDAKWSDGSPIQDAHFVNCVKCGVDNGDVIAGGFQTRELAVEHWNNRAPAESVSPAPLCNICHHYHEPGKPCYHCDDPDNKWSRKVECQSPVAAPQEVKRYGIIEDFNSYRLGEKSNGDYVLHSEYVSLREELQTLKRHFDLVSQTNSEAREKAESQLADMRKALQKMNADALVQVKCLFDNELYYAKKGDAHYARANDDKARFLLMYFPEIMAEAFVYRESLGADEVLRSALGEAGKL